MNYEFFHNPNEKNGYLSNWYLCRFIINGIEFSSMEQYMMYRKAICFQNHDIAGQILQLDHVAKIKEMGRLVKNYDENLWNGIRQIVVYEGLLAKFSQNKELRDALKSTDKSILAECAVNDRIWGIGLAMNDPRRTERTNWRGQNLLGYSLMMTREQV